MDTRFWRLIDIFVPSSAKARRRLIRADGKLGHYTSVEAAMSILRSGEAWLMPSNSTNDAFEVDYGYKNTIKSFCSAGGQHFRRQLELISADALGQAAEIMDSWSETIRRASYISSLSIHSKRQDRRGRLPMLRTYGGVAFVLNNRPFTSVSDALGANSAAVDYLEIDDFENRMRKLGDRVAKNSQFLRSCEPGIITNMCFQMFAHSMLCVKHPGFEEEKEWRVFLTESMSGQGTAMKKSVSTPRGQKDVFALPFVEPNGEALGVAIADIVFRVVVGPTVANSKKVKDDFVDLLATKGVDDAQSKVILSDTPFRAV